MIDIFAGRGAGGYMPSIMDRVEVGDCWLWQGMLNREGYGMVRSGDQRVSRNSAGVASDPISLLLSGCRGAFASGLPQLRVHLEGQDP